VAIPAFSDAWAQALLAAVNSDGHYADAAGDWTNPVALVVEASARVPTGVAVQLDLAAGLCRHAQSLSPAQVTAPFVLAAAIEVWEDIFGGRTDPLTAVARGQVALTQGSMFTLMLNARGARALLGSAQQIETLWP
jgi:putative sterol carrier protein